MTTSVGQEPTFVLPDDPVAEAALPAFTANVGSAVRGGPPARSREVGRSGAGPRAADGQVPGNSGEAAVPHLPAPTSRPSQTQTTLDLIDGALSDWSDDVDRDAMRWCPPETITLSSPPAGQYEEVIWGCPCAICRFRSAMHAMMRPLATPAPYWPLERADILFKMTRRRAWRRRQSVMRAAYRARRRGRW